MSDKRRGVWIPVDDGEKVVVYSEKGMKEREVPVPSDDQVTRDVEAGVLALEDVAKELHTRSQGAAHRGHHPAARTLMKRVTRVRAQAARLRAAFQLDQEDD